MFSDGCKILTYFSRIDENFFVAMRDARGCRTRLNEYFVKRAPIGAYKCFLKPDVYDNLWHPVLPTLGFYPKILGFFWDIGIFLGFLF